MRHIRVPGNPAHPNGGASKWRHIRVQGNPAHPNGGASKRRRIQTEAHPNGGAGFPCASYYMRHMCLPHNIMRHPNVLILLRILTWSLMGTTPRRSIPYYGKTIKTRPARPGLSWTHILAYEIRGLGPRKDWESFQRPEIIGDIIFVYLVIPIRYDGFRSWLVNKNQLRSGSSSIENVIQF